MQHTSSLFQSEVSRLAPEGLIFPTSPTGCEPPAPSMAKHRPAAGPGAGAAPPWAAPPWLRRSTSSQTSKYGTPLAGRVYGSSEVASPPWR